MDLQEILGEEFNPEMSFDEINAKLKGLDFISRDELKGKIDKSQFDKATSELAKLKKELKAKKSDEELKNDEFNELKDELELLKKEKQISEQKMNFISLGFQEKEASKAAKALVDKEFDAVFNYISEFQKLKEKEYKKAFMEQTPRPEVGEKNGLVQGKKISDMSLAELQALAKADMEAFNSLKGEYNG